MDSFITEVAKQVPSLGVLCFIVWIFIRHLGARDETLREMHKEHLDQREQTREVVKDNSQAIRDVTEAIGELRTVIQSKLTSNGK